MSAWDKGSDPNVAARARQLAELKARSPMRAPTPQHDAAHLPLFVAGNEPVML